MQATHQAGLRASSIVNALVEQGVTHVITLPDSETKFMYDAIRKTGSIRLVPVCREGEAIPIAAGLWAAGRKPVVIIQNSGLFESGDALRGLAIGVNLPLVMFIGYRGYTRHGDTADSAARFLEPYLHTWGVQFYLLEYEHDLERVSLAFKAAEETSLPVAVLVGVEYAEE
jgi:sulfopyruvate decarboxylase TPP-binding subunit